MPSPVAAIEPAYEPPTVVIGSEVVAMAGATPASSEKKLVVEPQVLVAVTVNVVVPAASAFPVSNPLLLSCRPPGSPLAVNAIVPSPVATSCFE